MSKEYVRPYVKAQKNDDRDAEAIAEAATRPTMRFVELKSEEQHDQQTLHRARSRLVGERTALINQLRGMLLELGITVAQGRRKLELHIATMMAETTGPLSARIRALIEDMRASWIAASGHSTRSSRREPIATGQPGCSRPSPGIGVQNATALTAAIGGGEAFGRARDLSAWLGLVPKQMTTGGKPRLLGISKRGNVYLRTLLIHGARAALPSLARSLTPIGDWLRGLQARAHPNTVVVALANKLARVAWAVLRTGRGYEIRSVAAG